MTTHNTTFKISKYDRRITKTHTAMTKAELDAIFVTNPSNQAWLTDYDE